MDVGGELFAVLAAESSEVLAELERVLEMVPAHKGGSSSGSSVSPGSTQLRNGLGRVGRPALLPSGILSWTTLQPLKVIKRELAWWCAH